MTARKLISRVVASAIGILASADASALEAMYERTEVGRVEVKDIPALCAITAEGSGTTFDNIGEPFKVLYRYLRKNKYAMTTPIEADTAQNRMRYFKPTSVPREKLATGIDVTIADMPARTVVSVGLKGSYSLALYTRGVQQLEAWLASSDAWEAAGPPYNVFWDPIWVPGFLKRSEVHIPVRKRAPGAAVEGNT